MLLILNNQFFMYVLYHQLFINFEYFLNFIQNPNLNLHQDLRASDDLFFNYYYKSKLLKLYRCVRLPVLIYKFNKLFSD